MTKEKTLKKEAEEFVKKKKPARRNQTLTLRRYYAGMALAGFLGSGQATSADEVVRQSFFYADKMIEND